MGRPRTGSVRRRRTRWLASVPRLDGRRMECSFDTEGDARQWVTEQLARLDNGRDARPPTRRPAPAIVGAVVEAGGHGAPATAAASGPFATLREYADAWWHERYVLLHGAQATRTKAVRQHLDTHILPVFGGPIGTDVVAGRAKVVAWTRAMAGYPPAPGDPPVGEDAKTYDRKYVGNLLWILSEVLLYAHTLGADVTVVVGGKDPKPALTHRIGALTPRGRVKRKAKLVSLSVTKSIAQRLHVVHQLVLWTMRLAGLRIGEAYGLIVANVICDTDGRTFLLVEAVGGALQEFRDEYEVIVTKERREQTKTEAGYRLIRVPEPLAVLFRLVIDAFHTDPVTGEVDMAARLVPPIRSEVGGPDGFRNALAAAVADLDDASRDPEDFVLPHDMRKAFATDLAYTAELDDLVKRRAMGHRFGSDVFDLIYTLDDRLKDAMAPAAQVIERAVFAEIGSAVVPTAIRPQYGRNRDAERLAYADAVLEDAGWQIDPNGGWVTAAVAARHLGMSVTATRRLFDKARIPAVKGRNGWTVRLDDVLAYRERLAGHRFLVDVADDAGIDYHTAHRTMRRLGIEPGRDDYSRQLLLTDAHAVLILAELERIDALKARAMTVAEAAGKLGCRHSSIHKWVVEERLAYDDETDASGKRYVTRASVDAELARRGPRRRPAVSVAVFCEATGFDDAAVRALVADKALVLIRRDHLCAESVRTWATGYRPDLLSSELLRGLPPKAA